MTDTTVELLTWRFTPPPGEDIVSSAARLRASGLKVADVAKELSVNERHVYRLLALARGREEDDLYTPFSLLDAVAEGRSVEETAYLFETSDQAEWSRGAARYAWHIHTARPSLAPRLVQAFATMYHHAAHADVEDRPRRSYVIDLALRLGPWCDVEARREFFARAPITGPNDAEFVVDVQDYLEAVTARIDVPYSLSYPDPDQAGELERILAEREESARARGDTVQLVSIPGSPRKRRRG